MIAPTIDALRARSELLAAKFPSEASSDDLDRFRAVRDDADALVSAITGRNIGVGVGVEVPPELMPIALRAITLKAEHLTAGLSSKARTAEMNRGRLKSISAGPWSESYVTDADLRKLLVLDADSALNEALMLLITPDKWAEFLADVTGVQPPAAAVTQFDGRRSPGSYEGHTGFGFGFGY